MLNLRPKRLKVKSYALAKSLLITLIYAFIGFAWIIGSEIALSLSHSESSAVFLINISKGLAFVAATALLMFILIYRNLRKIVVESEIRARSEEALNEAQRLAHIGSFVYDDKTNMLTGSNEALRMLNVDKTSFKGDLAPLFELVSLQDRSRVEQAAMVTLREQKDAQLICSITPPGGPSRTVQLRFVPKENGGTSFILGIIQDITERLQAENAAKENEAIYKTFINSGYDLIYLKDNALRYIAVNTNMQQFYGVSEDQLIGKKSSEVFPSPDAMFWEARDQRVLEQNKAEFVEDVGRDRVFETIIFPIDISEHKRGVGGIARDITQRKQAEAAVEQERDRAQTYLDNTAIINVAMDQDGFVTLINQAGCDKLGVTKAEVLGQNWIDRFVPPAEREYVRNIIRLVYEGVYQFNEVNENGVICANGEERRIEWRNSILRDAYGNFSGIFAAGVDVTELRQAMQALRESERSKSVLLSNLAGMAYRCAFDRNWTMQFVSNGCFNLTGYLPEELLLNRIIAFNDIICPEYRESIWEESSLRITAKQNNRYEYEILTASGERKWVLDINQGVFNEAGELEALEGIIIDITESKRQFLQIQYLNDHDLLTGLYNRSYFEAERNRMNREKVCPITLMHADINGLKLINDAFGSTTGDSIIQQTAKLLKSTIRSGDVLARIGGDEFALLLPGTDAKSAITRIQEIQATFDSFNAALTDRAMLINLSIGWGEKHSPEVDLSVIEKEAESTLSHRKLFDQKSHHNAVLSSIMTTLFERSYETEEHAERIGNLCVVVGERIGLEHADIDRLKLFAILHDIGKIGVSDHILNKPGALDEEETTQMRKHPEIGYRIAMSSPDLAPIAEFILTHHERWDGTGYPNRISGENIPLLSRILAVADAYDAMTQDRVYRKALPRDIVISEIQKNAGSQFDPRIAEIFLDTINQMNL